jgi:hypothetical protein
LRWSIADRTRRAGNETVDNSVGTFPDITLEIIARERYLTVLRPREDAEQAITYPLPPLPGVTPLTAQIREVFASA